ncbi:methanobactin [Candidatus Methylospira mobilis]|nr:methanobactin [Candidatus Methylospira mobilis]WNV03786.1 methanobactin [Candidatus Methylospira mobilis]
MKIKVAKKQALIVNVIGSAQCGGTICSSSAA